MRELFCSSSWNRVGLRPFSWVKRDASEDTTPLRVYGEVRKAQRSGAEAPRSPGGGQSDQENGRVNAGPRPGFSRGRPRCGGQGKIFLRRRKRRFGQGKIRRRKSCRRWRRTLRRLREAVRRAELQHVIRLSGA